jgi:hypothetical protein
MIASRGSWQFPRKTLDIRLPRAWPFLQNLVGVHNLYVGRLVSHVVEGDKEYIIRLSREANPVFGLDGLLYVPHHVPACQGRSFRTPTMDLRSLACGL